MYQHQHIRRDPLKKTRCRYRTKKKKSLAHTQRLQNCKAQQCKNYTHIEIYFKKIYYKKETYYNMYVCMCKGKEGVVPALLY